MTEDDWGFDPDFARTRRRCSTPSTELVARHADGLEHVPATGPALIVANHAGGVPWDAA